MLTSVLLFALAAADAEGETDTGGMQFGVTAHVEAGVSLQLSPLVMGTVGALAQYRFPSLEVRGTLGIVPIYTFGGSASVGGVLELELFYRLRPWLKLGLGPRAAVLAAAFLARDASGPVVVPPTVAWLAGLKLSPFVATMGPHRNIELGVVASFDALPEVRSRLPDGRTLLLQGAFIVTLGVQLAAMVL